MSPLLIRCILPLTIKISARLWQLSCNAALKRFVDDIAIKVIESKLISPLYDIFSPVTVTSMPADLAPKPVKASSALEFLSKYANYNPSNDDEGSNNRSKLDVRSLFNGSYNCGRPSSKDSDSLSREIAKSVVKPGSPGAIKIPEAESMPPAEEEVSYFPKKKKYKRKSKAAA
ncbi:hypothetical protein LHYA1_G006173 [Lachnellula hyalina]|uniref:Uncharacterized protein n=1 Tax=Lachnellula hyalina TaxID=1316788 RepID=A0A8H8R2R9_9HELO|nr:uncharacterized protein LHYA1_G006173 [Lachnellula hyalina]TVY25834.1 hypothetical protein LHYA1_G006173 [Lachnellula hyalina]